MNKIFSFFSPYMLWIKIAFCVILAIGGFYVGMKTQQTFDDAANTTQYEKIIIGMGKQLKQDRLLILAHQEKEAKINTDYVQLGKELKNANGKLASCKVGGNVIISDVGARLWNNINQGKPLSEDTTGAIESSPGTSPSITLEDVYENHVLNSKICTGLREQILGIIEWDKKTFPVEGK